MPLQLRSRPTTDALRSSISSPTATPASKPQIPTILLITATPSDTNQLDDANPVALAPRMRSGASPAPLAPKPTTNRGSSRKRLVPKKSKLSLLGTSPSVEKDHAQESPDGVRRVEDALIDNENNGFEIYVDPANDPDIGDIMVVKKKSRLGLDGLQWGTLGEVTNVPSVTKPKEKGRKKESTSKVKVDENQKWWSIGRSRKDSKEKDKGKDKDCTKPPQPTDVPTTARARHTSLDLGILLAGSVIERPKPPAEHARIPTPPSATRALPGGAGAGSGKNSVAIRAMRSVRSLARIGSWAQLKNMANPDVVAAPVKEEESDGKKKKKKKDKDKDSEKEKAKETIRYSGSSFEAGTLSAGPVASKPESKSLGKKKSSILGLGLPSTIRLPSSRSGSAGSSFVANTTNHRSSLDSANLLGSGILARERFGSTISTASSLRPMSTKSRVSRESSGSSGAASVRWDEAGLQTAKELRRKDKEIKQRAEESKEKKKSKKSKSKSEKDSTRKLSDSRKRTPLSAIFPRGLSEREEDVVEQPPTTPIVDGHDFAPHVVNPQTDTPVKHVRPRPTSEQPLGQTRPKPLHKEDEDNAVLSLLDAATNDLAQLINRLDLEATPGSVEMTPMGHHSPFFQDSSAVSLLSNRSTAESPVKDLRRANSSITSLKPYSRSGSKTVSVQLGQNIAPWSTLNAGISPSKSSPDTIKGSQGKMVTVQTHKRTPPAPAVDPSPVFKALRPATSRLPISKTVVSASSGVSPFVINPADRSPSTLTFGSGHSSRGSLSASPVFKKALSITRKRSSLSQHAALDSHSLPILPEVRRNLGLTGTMGGSIGSIAEQDHDGSDPDSDIPDELQVILSNSDQEGDDTISFACKPAQPSPGLPPALPPPLLDYSSFRSSLAGTPFFQAAVVDEAEHQVGGEEADTLSEDDTKKSFDFTGELRRLNASGASDRRSFIEQLENAFRTPAKIDLQYDFKDLPLIPKLPTLQDELSQFGESSSNLTIDYESREPSPKGFPVDVDAEPSLLPGSDGFATGSSDDEPLHIVPQEIPVPSQPSNGELNRNFKFGGKHSSSNKGGLPLTLSDIIPPPEIAKSLSMASLGGDESFLMKSILAHAVKIESPPMHSDSRSGPNSKPEARDAPSAHKRNSSALSFAGFDSFAEVRRGFEFNDNRPGFYPPPATMSDRRHRKHESIHSIASISSYGNVLHGGSADPFDYSSTLPLPSLRERPSSDDFSFTMSTSIDDTFSYLRRPQPRRRVDSDASSFYFRTSFIHPYNRSHRRHESGVSVGPPISLFNRNSTYHRRGDSNTSMSSIAQSYANCRRFSWSRRRSNFSAESVFSDFSGTNLGRPGLGDKMLDSAPDCGTTLTSISASPHSLAGSAREERIYYEQYENRASCDSVMDTQYESQKTDSLFEQTGCRNSVCSSDSTFFEQDMDNAASKPPRYRPISSLSIPSVHSPPKEDDTMISMLGGGHVRRRSVTSMIGASPCIQVERRKNILSNPPETVFNRIQKVDPQNTPSPHVIETKPSIVSTVNSSTFGNERMIRAKHGLLERQSLEDSVLIGDGEDPSGLPRVPVFHRPNRANRSRSSTSTSSSGADTPPLSISDGYSSFSEGSLSSIDLSHLNTLLSSTTHPLSNAAFDRIRPHARGHRHRRRISQARASRTSIYETIEEELHSSLPSSSSSEHSILGSAANTTKLAETETKTMDPPQVYVVDPETSSVNSFSPWDDERGIATLRRYYALRDEAEDTIIESKRTWLDTPFSTFAVQSFDPPRHPSGMQAMLEHSLQNYGPLPSELRVRHIRSRVNSRPSPYPRTIKTSFTSHPSVEHLRATVAASLIASAEKTVPRHLSPPPNALQSITINTNVVPTVSPTFKDCPVSPDKPERMFGLPPRPRVALGWSKKSTGRNGVENKENNTTIGNISIRASTAANVSQGTLMTTSDGLRLNRPRPKKRPTPASTRPVRA